MDVVNGDLSQRVAIATADLPWTQRGEVFEKLLEQMPDRRTALVHVPTGAQLPVGWSKLEICGTKGTHGHLEVYLDGTRIDQNVASDVNLGVDSFAQVEIGDRAKNQTFAFSIDDVIVDTQPI